MKNNSIDKKKIEELLPHRDPMLLIDKLINIIPLKYDASRWINQGISCMCNQIEREGKLINYFE